MQPAATLGNSPAVYPILLVNFIGTLGYSIVLPFLVVIVIKFGGDELIYGILSATFSAFQLVGAPVLGSWSDRYGRKKILLLSTFGTIIAWIIFLGALILPDAHFSVNNPWGSAFIISVPLVLIFVSRAMDGVTGGNVSVANAYLADISTKQQRKKNFGRMSAAANLGLIFGPVLAGVLGATAWGNILPVAVALLISVAAVVIISLKLQEVPPGNLTGPVEEAKTAKVFGHEHKECYRISSEKQHVPVLKLPDVKYLIGMYFLIFLAFNFFYVAFPVYVTQSLKWSILQLGVFFSVISGVLVIVQGPVLARLSIKFSSAKLVIAGSIVLALSFALFRTNSLPVIYTGALFFGLGNGVMWPSFLVILSNVADDRYQGAVQGYASSAGSLASITGLISGAFLYRTLGISIFLLAAAFMLLIAVCSVRLIRIEAKNDT